MLTLDDIKWQQLKGGYHDLYDPTPALRRLESGDDPSSIWEEFWNELHHQGAVDEASYATVPQLVKLQQEHGQLGWNFYALISTIEIERQRKKNPPLPTWLRDSYAKAWHDILPMALAELQTSEDELVTRTALAALAIAKGQLKFGAILLKWDSSEIDEILDEHFSWSEMYNLAKP